MNLKSVLALGILTCSTAAFAADANSDMKAVKFTGEVSSKAPYQLKFRAPAGHHFNLEAPAKVELVNDAASTVGKLDKTLQTVTVDFAKDTKPAATCSVKANLFVCNEGNTYCLPVRQEFDCVKLQAKN